ncbi:MAG TPA: DNA polymerase ligase N-terminal domain-containing protein, partial [Longimicrobiales bacterium]|nr:DNA polymerase ligase N-terminal domain-containing protein [Longimicrobiales bacterium]
DSYRRKRDFRKTVEPKGGDVSASENGPRFVIQEHGASSHHFDFRLEVEGVLRSWAVPKGPSTDPRDKRLAMPTEDHPLEYGDFEGVIAEGEYGAGAVLVWDAGSYRNLKEDDDGNEVPLADQLADGHATVWLEGEKLRGGYALTRVATGDDERWLLVKMDDEEADARRNPVSTEPESVKTGRTLEEVAEEEKEEG